MFLETGGAVWYFDGDSLLRAGADRKPGERPADWADDPALAGRAPVAVRSHLPDSVRKPAEDG